MKRLGLKPQGTLQRFQQSNPDPCISVIIMNSRDVIAAGRTVGLEYPEPRRMRALLDTGASITVISRVFADYCKLFQTNEGSEITAIGATHRCAEHAGAISFPGYQAETIRPHSHRFGRLRKRTTLRLFDWQRHSTKLGYHIRWAFSACNDYRLTAGTAALGRLAQARPPCPSPAASNGCSAARRSESRSGLPHT